MRLVAGLVALVSLMQACDASVSSFDGGDADMADRTAQETGPNCDQYCNCETVYCNASLPTGISCRDFCAMFTAQQRDCRTNHCVLAAMDDASVSSHCPHTVGQGGLCM